MSDFSLGSVHDAVLSRIENVPSFISGTTLLEMADEQRQYCEDYIGQTIGSNSIGIRHRGAIINLAMAETLYLMNMVGIDAVSVKLGDFSETKGGKSNTIETAQKLEERGKEMIDNIGHKISFHKALGVLLGLAIFLNTNILL